MQAAPRINAVVQWVRTRFNDALEKSDFVARKLLDAQRRLPLDHPHHPHNVATAASTTSSTGGASSAGDNVLLTSGVTAEKLMYERALEMSRGAAVCELTNEDLESGVLSYRTAVYMLEAILDGDEYRSAVPSRNSKDRDRSEEAAGVESETINGLEAEDRATVQKRKIFPRTDMSTEESTLEADIKAVLESLRIRLRTIKKKIEAQKHAAKRASTSATPRAVGRESPAGTPMLSRSPAR